jgi:hypothetical protein
MKEGELFRALGEIRNLDKGIYALKVIAPNGKEWGVSEVARTFSIDKDHEVAEVLIIKCIDGVFDWASISVSGLWKILNRGMAGAENDEVFIQIYDSDFFLKEVKQETCHPNTISLIAQESREEKQQGLSFWIL